MLFGIPYWIIGIIAGSGWASNAALILVYYRFAIKHSPQNDKESADKISKTIILLTVLAAVPWLSSIVIGFIFLVRAIKNMIMKFKTRPRPTRENPTREVRTRQHGRNNEQPVTTA